MVAEEEAPFYYHQGERVPLDVDPEYLVVAAAEPGADRAATEVLAGLGVRVAESKALPQARGHFVLRLAPGTSRERALAARGRLRADGRFEFASTRFKVHGGNSPITPINRVNVQFKSETSVAQIDSLARALNLRVERRARPDSARFTYWFKYPHGGKTDFLEVAAQLDRHPLVAWADPDKVAVIARQFTPSDPLFGYQYYLRNTAYSNGVRVDINVEPAWDLTRGGRAPSTGGLTIAVIDDGVQAGHPDLPNVEFGYDVFGNNTLGCHPCAYSPDGNYSHGTQVAGIIGAAHDGLNGIAGIAPEAYIVPVRIFSNSGGATDAMLADGINYAWYWAFADVLNNSWGYTDPEYGGNNSVTNAISDANSRGRGGKGAIVVFSAGNTSNRNGGYEGKVLYPARLSSVISVGAIDRYGRLANYTPNGYWVLWGVNRSVDIVAPSGYYTGQCLGDVVTTDLVDTRGCNDSPDGNLDYAGTFSGTSAAAPQVAGVAALLLAREPALSASDVKNRLYNGADNMGSNNAFGRGKLNAYRTLVP